MLTGIAVIVQTHYRTLLQRMQGYYGSYGGSLLQEAEMLQDAVRAFTNQTSKMGHLAAVQQRLGDLDQDLSRLAAKLRRGI
jgi:hypothetical protein